jgi:NAD(P)-dependent dehydrogenase (short-subunit alcohol dehydrogenase family)
VPIGDYEEMLRINVTGTMLCTRYALPSMIERRYGRIINLSSQLGAVGAVGGGSFAAYAATKGAVDTFTKAMAHEFGPYGITVNAVAPGEIATRMNDAEDADVEQESRDGIPSGRPGHAREVASLVSWLASPGAGYATGHSFVIDGGLMLMAVGERRPRPAAPLGL